MLPKNSTFSDRQAASAAAKKALLEKFKPKPMVVAAEPIDHDKERREKLEAIRAEREVERLERQRAREEAARIAEEERVAALVAAETARVEAELSVDAMKRAERKERKKAIKDAARQKKEVRQTVKSTPVQERLSPREEHERYIRDLERARA